MDSISLKSNNLGGQLLAMRHSSVMAAVRMALQGSICSCNKEYKFSKGLRSKIERIWPIRAYVFSS